MSNPTDWQPSASIDSLKQRAQIYASIREFFSQRHYWEVETPVMAHFGITDAGVNPAKEANFIRTLGSRGRKN